MTNSFTKSLLCATCLTLFSFFTTTANALVSDSGSGEATLTVVTNWSTGYYAEVTITNLHSTADILNWFVELDLGASTITSIWNGNLTGTSDVTPATWTKNIPLGGSVSFGFIANGTAPSSGGVKMLIVEPDC